MLVDDFDERKTTRPASTRSIDVQRSICQWLMKKHYFDTPSLDRVQPTQTERNMCRKIYAAWTWNAQVFHNPSPRLEIHRERVG